MSLTMTRKFKKIRSRCPWPVFWTLSTFGFAFHLSHAHLHLLLEQLVLYLWWLQPCSQGVFPGLEAVWEKDGCGASSRSASAASFNSLDSVISEYEKKATTRRTDRASTINATWKMSRWDIRDFGVCHMEHRNLIRTMSLVSTLYSVACVAWRFKVAP